MTHHITHKMSTPKPQTIQTHPVKSSSLKEIGYDPDTETLAVRFHSGGLYHYQGVTQAERDELMAADSHGRHFIKAILPKKKHTKIVEDEAR